MNKKEDLDNFEWFNLNLSIHDLFFDDETDNLYRNLKLIGYGKKKRILKLVILNLFKVYLEDKTKYVVVYRTADFYSKANLPPRNNPNECSYRLLIDVLDSLIKRRMIEYIKGRKYSGVSRIKMIKILIDCYKKGMNKNTETTN